MLNILFISIALAMDSFSVALCAGATLVSPGIRKPILVGSYFGFFQFAMALIGYLGGAWIASRIGGIDHWIAFGILLIIGGKMILSFWQESKSCDFSFSHMNLSMLALATSIDALGAGASLALIDVNILMAVATIGIVAFGLSFIGVRGGRLLSKYIKNYAELSGGVLLLLIAIKILFDHGVFLLN